MFICSKNKSWWNCIPIYTRPANVNTAVETHNFLEVCNLLFEKDFQSHEKLTGMESNVLQNISKGY